MFRECFGDWTTTDTGVLRMCLPNFAQGHEHKIFRFLPLKVIFRENQLLDLLSWFCWGPQDVNTKLHPEQLDPILGSFLMMRNWLQEQQTCGYSTGVLRMYNTKPHPGAQTRQLNLGNLSIKRYLQEKQTDKDSSMKVSKCIANGVLRMCITKLHPNAITLNHSWSTAFRNKPTSRVLGYPQRQHA